MKRTVNNFRHGMNMLRIAFWSNFCGFLYFIVVYGLDKFEIMRASEADKVLAIVFIFLTLNTLCVMNFFGTYIEQLTNLIISNGKIEDLKDPGFIYLLKRADGIYKIGKTVNVPGRVKGHISDYGMAFEIVHVWCVPSYSFAERIALKLTESYIYKEDNRVELRKMNNLDVILFIETFSRLAVNNDQKEQY